MRDIAIVAVTLAGLFIGIHFYDNLVPQQDATTSEQQVSGKSSASKAHVSKTADSDAEWDALDSDEE
jgi:hypothetical protein